ncbi:MAG: hypothetical protein ACOVKO_02125 [Elstera sp.]
MITPNTLYQAVAGGIITEVQRQQLLALEASNDLPQDDEKLRFITGFGDIFVAIGLVLFLGALGYFLSQWTVTAIGVGLAVACWGLAEFFTRKRRMALPSLLLLIGFVGSVLLAVSFGLARLQSDRSPDEWHFAVGGLIAAIAAWGHYRRFKTPISPAAGCGALTSMLVTLVYAAAPDTAPVVIPFLLLISGIIAFTLALRLDFQDPRRETRRTDIAFWLHLLAAPLIVHPTMFWIGALSSDTNPVLTLGLFFVLALVALMADRRAILVSGLLYAGTAIFYLGETRGLSADTPIALALLLLGALILALSAGWRTIRLMLLTLLPTSLRRILPQTP